MPAIKELDKKISDLRAEIKAAQDQKMEVKRVEFEKFIVSHFGRLLKRGDIIHNVEILSNGMNFSGEYRVLSGLVLQYHGYELEVKRTKVKRAGGGYNTFTKTLLKSFKFKLGKLPAKIKRTCSQFN